jgi:hypothetical protein
MAVSFEATSTVLDPPVIAPHRGGTGTPVKERPFPLVAPWLRGQALNLERHAEALRPFDENEFGTGDESPSSGHIKAVNDMITALRGSLLRVTGKVRDAAETAIQAPTTENLQRLAHLKDRGHTWVQGIETIWDFYFELFGQRQSKFAVWLLGCDRIALDCYQYAYLGVGMAKSVPAPAPFCYMRTGFSPATYRRGIPLRKLGQQLNPFPLIQLPYHRLVNPWTLGAMLHEVSHNLQSDLGLARSVPVAIGRRLLAAGFPPAVAATWVRWNREIYADLSALLLGGPSICGSLLDILARAPEAMVHYTPRAPHPTPGLRAYINFELLRRMGYDQRAQRFGAMWRRVYGDLSGGTIPRTLLGTASRAIPVVVDAICYQPYQELGNKTLAQVFRFEDKEQQMIEEAAGRLAKGTEPGVVPARFLIPAARVAVQRGLGDPEKVAQNFYAELGRR